ncbi:MAG: hypothetical protein IT269_14955 [Saprospiraceae bacterium]|nr:hypothetical protein [Saprospiraceae bacterium]
MPTNFELDEKHRKSLFRNGELLLQQVYVEYPRGYYAGMGFVPTMFLGQGQFIPTWIMAGKRWKLHNPHHVIQLNVLLLDQPAGQEISMYNVNYGFGNEDKNLSFGYGFAIGLHEVENSVRGNWTVPALTVRGLVRISRHHWFVSENYLINTKEGICPFTLSGLRWMKPKLSVDLAMIYGLMPTKSLLEGRRPVLLPWLSFQMTFPKAFLSTTPPE